MLQLNIMELIQPILEIRKRQINYAKKLQENFEKLHRKAQDPYAWRANVDTEVESGSIWKMAPRCGLAAQSQLGSLAWAELERQLRHMPSTITKKILELNWFGPGSRIIITVRVKHVPKVG